MFFFNMVFIAIKSLISRFKNCCGSFKTTESVYLLTIYLISSALKIFIYWSGHILNQYVLSCLSALVFSLPSSFISSVSFRSFMFSFISCFYSSFFLFFPSFAFIFFLFFQFHLLLLFTFFQISSTAFLLVFYFFSQLFSYFLLQLFSQFWFTVLFYTFFYICEWAMI